MSIDKWRDTQNVVYPYSGISFCLKKEGVPVTCYMMILEDIMLSEISQSQVDRIAHLFWWLKWLWCVCECVCASVTESPSVSKNLRATRGGARTCPRALTAERAVLEIPNKPLDVFLLLYAAFVNVLSVCWLVVDNRNRKGNLIEEDSGLIYILDE